MKRICLLLIGVIFAVFFPPTTSRAAFDTVTNCSGDYAVVGSLPHVLAAAASGDTITFTQDCAGQGAIPLTFELVASVSVAIDATIGAHTIAITTASGSIERLLFVNPGITLNLIGLTFTSANNTRNTGGAINNTYGSTVHITACTFSGNTSGGNGGAIDNGSTGTMTISNSTFSGNTTIDGFGGAINNTSEMTITGSTFSGNRANAASPTYGGAIHN